MKTRDIIYRAGRNLKQAKIRTLLTSLAISVGAFTIMISLAAGVGARNYANQVITSNIDPQVLFITKDKTLFSGGSQNASLTKYSQGESSVTRGGESITEMNQVDLEKLQKRSDLTDVHPTYQLQVQYVTIGSDTQKYVASVTAYNPNVKNDTAAGLQPKLGVNLGENDVIIPKSFATTLGVSAESLVGKTMTLHLARAAAAPTADQIEKVLATDGTAGLSQLAVGQTKDISLTIRAVTTQSSTAVSASNSARVSNDTAGAINDFSTKDTDNYQKYIAVTARAKQGSDPASVKRSLQKDGFYAETAKDLQGFLFTIVNILQGIVLGFGVIALIASVFGIVNTQYISVLERTSQIGLMKALGARRRDISRLFRYEAAWIGFLGGTIGIALAWLASYALNPLIAKAFSLDKGTNFLMPTIIPAILLLVGLILVAIVAGYFPSRKAARLDPIEALRTE